MKRAVLAVAIFAIVIVFGAFTPLPSAEGQTPKATTSQKWQYVTRYYWEFTNDDGLGELATQITHVRSMNVDLTKYGNDGYEVVSVVAFHGTPSGRDPFRKLNHVIVILKRPAK